MTSITAQKELVNNLKKETYLNIQLLCKVQPLPETLSRQIFKENALEKPTQNVFNHLSHYFVSILDPEATVSLPWPLYDTATERAYRNAFSKLIADYSLKGLVSPVRSSYLVNPTSFKVTVLMFQLSQLAVKNIVLSTVDEKRKEMCMNMTEKYNSDDKTGFIEAIDEEINKTLVKYSNYYHKNQRMEKIVDIMQNSTQKMEEKLASLNPQKFINTLVDGFVSKYECEDVKNEILKIKNVSKKSAIFDAWLIYYDERLVAMEKKWEDSIKPFLSTCKKTRDNTEDLIARHTGEAVKSSYMIEYNPKTDEISTKDLEMKVNSEQKYILKNIVKEDRLNFPNLIRSFVIAICYILKNMENGDEVMQFNQYFEDCKRSFAEVTSTMKNLNNKIMDAETKLNSTPSAFKTSISIRELSDIPPLPDLSGLKIQRDIQTQILLDTFTPFSSSKHQFNLNRKRNVIQPKSLVTPYHQTRDDFIKNIVTSRTSFYDHSTMSQNINNISVIPHTRCNETIAECSSGFTKQQIMRLLSTKKSSAKKLKFKPDRSEINSNRGLFEESTTSNESSGLFRSYSSPNLYENREKKALHRRKLSIMQEVSPTVLEVSGIIALNDEANCDTPEVVNLRDCKIPDTLSLPLLTLTPDHRMKDIEPKIDFDLQKNDTEYETPKTNSNLVKKTGSLEKIINRFKKVRASVLPNDKIDDDFKTIIEEKENFNIVNVDVFTANRDLLPDLLSPSCSVVNRKSRDYLDDIRFDLDNKGRKKPRESLGTALGVDETFLDQFDLID